MSAQLCLHAPFFEREAESVTGFWRLIPGFSSANNDSVDFSRIFLFPQQVVVKFEVLPN